MKIVINNYIEKEDCYEIEIINTKEEKVSTYIDKEDLISVKKEKWSFKRNKKGYTIIKSTTSKDYIPLHRYVLKDANGIDDPTKVVDHIDRNPLNNRKSNLRIVSHSINSINAKPRIENKSGIRGVYFRPKREKIAEASWVCEWSIEGERHSRSFSIAKYGEEEAFRLACSLRQEKIQQMKI